MADIRELMARYTDSWAAERCADAFLIQGCMDLYRAGAWTQGKAYVLELADAGVTRDGVIADDSALCSRALIFALEETGEERFHAAAEACVRNCRRDRGGCDARWLERMQRTLPLCMEYEMKLGRMEHVSDVVDGYKYAESVLCGAQRANCIRQLASLAQSIELANEQLYEHYRALVDMFRAGVRKLLCSCDAQMNGYDDESRALAAYALLKGVRLGVLDDERYLQGALDMFESLAPEDDCRCKGALRMAYAEYLLAGRA